MAKIKLSDYIAKRLRFFYHVERIFMVSGGGAMHLNDSFGQYIPYTSCHHEQACAIAAEGYARINQKLAVVNVTTGPGGLNALNGVFGQWTDSVPVLYISGQVKRRTMIESFPSAKLRQLGDQEVDIISIVKPLTKYAITVINPNEIKYHLDKAIYEATSGRFGPVWINVPMDIQAAIIEENELKEFNTPDKPIYDLKINDIIKKLKSSKYPLIIAGHGIRLSGQKENFMKFINETNIPVVTTFNGFDLIPSDHKNYVGRIGTIGQRAGNFALNNADLILCFGTRNNIRQVSYNWENFGKKAYKIVVDIDKTELDKPLVIPDLKVNADLKDFLPRFITGFLSDKKQKSLFCDWLDFCVKIRDKYSFKNYKEQKQKADQINPYYFTYFLTKIASKDSIFVSANATPSICLFQNAKTQKSRILVNSGDASMGYGLPAAIGAFYQSQGRDVICVEGDGSIMMNIQELQTIVFNKLPIKIFIINNRGYSSIRQTQKNFFNGRMTGSGIESGVGIPDFVKVGQAFGIKTKRIDNPKTMEDDIKTVLGCNEPILCEVLVEEEYMFLPKLSSRKLPDGTMVSPSLEDMFPFLPREEYELNIIGK